ncbi:SDR family NAD(P)-dependent oxidoreductase [Meiothermus rufus]|uniref:SDR family NAD(P)-dependent oxidoreductase n=1 Tax=Meiothermus rufus TaxID=604332 RepID=UPI000481722B|nr:SDR family NAD(P)-dependent oxidoreductase [Meiothermus rufus]
MRVCLLVGMGRGLGLSLAQRFGREGFRLALLARSQAQLQNYSGALELDGYTARAFCADAAHPTQLISAIREAFRQLGPIEVLIYNAYSGQDGPASTLSPEALEATLRVNLYGALVAAQQVIPSMRARRKGTLLFTGDGLALNPQPHQAALSIGKASLRALVGSLSKELYHEDIHVATVTIAGQVKRHTPFDPDLIAEKFWELHTQPPGHWKTEVVYQG